MGEERGGEGGAMSAIPVMAKDGSGRIEARPPPPKASGPPSPHQRLARVQAFLWKNVLPVGFALVLTIALSWPAGGRWVSQFEYKGYRLVQTVNVVVIFIISGLTLKTDEIKQSFSKEGRAAYFYGVVTILFITALLGFIAVEIPFSVKSFSYGLAVFCTAPTTLSSGVTLVNQAKGNGALALLLTVTTNLLGVVTVPFMLKLVLGQGAAFNAVTLLVKLIITLLIPLVIGKAARELIPGIKPIITKHKKWISLVSNISLIMIVWQTLSRSANDLIGTKFVNILSVIVAGVLLHFIYLSINYSMATRVLRLQPREMKAIVLMCSQKTLPVSITVIGFLTDLGEEGLMAIPCIIGHMSQLFVDAYIVSKWASEAQKEEKEKGEKEEGMVLEGTRPGAAAVQQHSGGGANV